MTKVIAFFKLIRWFHELLAVLPFVSLYIIINFAGSKSERPCNLDGFDFLLLCLCVQLLIAAGCVLNDIMDRGIDKINKPKTHIIDNFISLKGAKIIFAVFTVLIILLSIYITKYMFFEWAFIAAAVYFLSILYDVYLKRSPLFGNILMAMLTSGIPLVLFFYAADCIKNLDNEKINTLIYLYSIFPPLIIIPRELSLDISDIEGDKACGCNTLPVLIGIKRSRVVVISLLILIILLSIPLAFTYHYLAPWLIIADLLLIVYLLLFKRTESRIEYIRIGRFLWFIMIFGLIGFTIATMYSIV